MYLKSGHQAVCMAALRVLPPGSITMADSQAGLSCQLLVAGLATVVAVC
jgi:hypothetical protein